MKFGMYLFVASCRGTECDAVVKADSTHAVGQGSAD